MTNARRPVRTAREKHSASQAGHFQRSSSCMKKSGGTDKFILIMNLTEKTPAVSTSPTKHGWLRVYIDCFCTDSLKLVYTLYLP